METVVLSPPRRLGPADAASLAALEARCFPDPWSAEIFAAAFVRPVFAAFGIFGPEGLAAYATVHLVAGELEILNIAVAPERRGRGLGGQLLGHVLQHADKVGINRGFLEVRAGNVPAKRLYARHGPERGLAPPGLRSGRNVRPRLPGHGVESRRRSGMYIGSMFDTILEYNMDGHDFASETEEWTERD